MCNSYCISILFSLTQKERAGHFDIICSASGIVGFAVFLSICFSVIKNTEHSSISVAKLSEARSIRPKQGVNLGVDPQIDLCSPCALLIFSCL